MPHLDNREASDKAIGAMKVKGKQPGHVGMAGLAYPR